MSTATYYHKGDSPFPMGPDYECCIKIVINGQTVCDDAGITYLVPKSGKNDLGEWITIFENGTGSSKFERAHLGCCAVVRRYAESLDLELSSIAYGGVI